MTDSEKTSHSNQWRKLRDCTSQLEKNIGQTFLLILGECMQFLQEKMKQETVWNDVSILYDPLALFRLIEMVILVHTEDQHPFATVYDQELSFYLFHQNTMSNAQWYEQFNTKVDVSTAIGITRQHTVLLEYLAQELHAYTFTTITLLEQDDVRIDAVERYLSYAF